MSDNKRSKPGAVGAPLESSVRAPSLGAGLRALTRRGEVRFFGFGCETVRIFVPLLPGCRGPQLATLRLCQRRLMACRPLFVSHFSNFNVFGWDADNFRTLAQGFMRGNLKLSRFDRPVFVGIGLGNLSPFGHDRAGSRMGFFRQLGYRFGNVRKAGCGDGVFCKHFAAPVLRHDVQRMSRTMPHHAAFSKQYFMRTNPITNWRPNVR